MTTTFAKTTDGQHEIETRSRRIAPRARTLLILVDGKRSDTELLKLVPQGDETLQALLEAGLIEPVGGPEAASGPAPKVAVGTTGPAADTPAAASWESRRREAVRAVNDLLGPEAEGLALRLERATDQDQLRNALERAVAYIANARGGGAAAQFAGRFLVGPGH